MADAGKVIRRGLETIVRPLGELGTKATNELKAVADKIPLPDMGDGITRNRGGSPPAPVPEPLPVMPLMDSEEIKRVRRRYTAQQMHRGGRESTKLTSDKLGAG